jgi:hypothetical protein
MCAGRAGRCGVVQVLSEAGEGRGAAVLGGGGDGGGDGGVSKGNGKPGGGGARGEVQACLLPCHGAVYKSLEPMLSGNGS